MLQYKGIMINSSDPIFEKWQKEQVFLQAQKVISPELFVKVAGLEPEKQLSRVGIALPITPLSPGFVKYYPFDFIVEEWLADNSVVTVDSDIPSSTVETAPFFHADLVKIGISTIDAIKELASKLNIKETQIGYGGIKDAIALTSQRISVSGVSLSQLLSLPEGNFFLKNIQPAQTAISMNNTLGNRFTIFVRTPEPLDEKLFVERLTEIQEHGFWNFYWLQRFGNRLLSHWWGLLLLQGKEEKAVRSYLCESGPNELPYIANLRDQANKQFENWEEIIKLFEPLGFTLRNELLLLNSLKEYRRDYVGALRAIPEQVKMWVYAYGSSLFNEILTFGSREPSGVPSSLPLLLSNNNTDHEIYRNFLERDKVGMDFANKIRRFDFIRFVSRKAETKLFPKILGYKLLPEGVILSFDLPKGAYATTFLSHIFTLDGRIGSVVKDTAIDMKELLGTGTASPTLRKLEKFIVLRQPEVEE